MLLAGTVAAQASPGTPEPPPPVGITMGSWSGGGNLVRDDETVAPWQITDLTALHCGMARVSAASPANHYFQGDAPSPSRLDGICVALLNVGIQPYFSFVFTDHMDSAASGFPDRNYADWFDIGAAFAARFKPNSAFLVGQGITDLGAYGYSAINEPDVDGGEILPNPPTTFGLTYAQYHDMLEGLADGVHSEDPDGRVFPAGYLSGNRDQEYTGHGYCAAVADLINDGTLAGFDLHTYHSRTGAALHNTYGRSHQSDADAFVTACGITRQDIDIICTETNIRGDSATDPNDATSQDYAALYPGLTNEQVARNWFLTSMVDVWGTLRPDGQLSQGPRFPWQLWRGGNDLWYMAAQLDPRVELWCGHTFKMLLDLLWDMHFTFNDPRGTGVHKLSGGGKTAWVFQNIHSSWSSISGSTFTISDIPAGTTQVQVYDGNGLIQTVSTPTLQVPSHQFSTPTGKSYLFVGNAEAADGGGFLTLDSGEELMLDDGSVLTLDG